MRLLLLASVLALLSAPALDAEPALWASPDVTLGSEDGIAALADEQTALLMPGRSIAVPIPELPASAELTAYAHGMGSKGGGLLSFGTHTELPGLLARSGDVVRFAPHSGTFVTVFDATAAGLPPGVVTDAVAETRAGPLLLSFDSTVVLGGLVVEDEDLVTWDGSGFSLALDGSAAGVDRTLDVDAVDVAGRGGAYALSFDTGGSVGGVSFRDEDVLLFERASGTWTLLIDASERGEGWENADLDAVALPEPGPLAMLAAGGLLLAGLRRRR